MATFEVLGFLGLLYAIKCFWFLSISRKMTALWLTLRYASSDLFFFSVGYVPTIALSVPVAQSSPAAIPHPAIRSSAPRGNEGVGGVQVDRGYQEANEAQFIAGHEIHDCCALRCVACPVCLYVVCSTLAVVFGFAFCGVFVFGHMHIGYHNIWAAMSTLLRFPLGDFNYQELSQVRSTTHTRNTTSRGQSRTSSVWQSKDCYTGQAWHLASSADITPSARPYSL